jgi:ubiquinone biosynthesis protein
MERVYGIPLNNLDKIKNSGLNLKKLSENGVEIFFTQVFRDGFFHADMHPGNMFIDSSDPENPRYLGVDFGIMGTLNEEDQHYLALNMLAFFNRDYKRVATLHVESGWVDPDTRIDQFEAAIRTVCEPIFERPLSSISFGNLLLRLFQTAERFNMHVQPQLLLLQKTLFSIESLGRQLYPELDLWQTAKPFLTRWLKRQQGFSSLFKLASNEWHDTIEALIKMPQQMQRVLTKLEQPHTATTMPSLHRPIRRRIDLLIVIVGTVLVTLGLNQWLTHGIMQPTHWLELGSGATLLPGYWLGR